MTSRSKPFQHLQFLVRDWQNFDAELRDEDDLSTREEIFRKLKEEMNSYLLSVIADKDANSSSSSAASELQTTRDQIARCFAKVDCFLLPHPGPRVVRKNYSGAIAEMDPFFRSMICAYTHQILNIKSSKLLQPKLINNRTLTAPELLTYFTTYVRMFQTVNSASQEEGGDGSTPRSMFPKAMTMLQATAEANNRNAKDLSLALYRKALLGLGSREAGFKKEDELVRVEEAARKEALAFFDGMANMGAEAHIAKFRYCILPVATMMSWPTISVYIYIREQLVADLDTEFATRKESNAVMTFICFYRLILYHSPFFRSS